MDILDYILNDCENKKYTDIEIKIDSQISKHTYICTRVCTYVHIYN